MKEMLSLDFDRETNRRYAEIGTHAKHVAERFDLSVTVSGARGECFEFFREVEAAKYTVLEFKLFSVPYGPDDTGTMVESVMILPEHPKGIHQLSYLSRYSLVVSNHEHKKTAQQVRHCFEEIMRFINKHNFAGLAAATIDKE
jgi:hypothetical protein